MKISASYHQERLWFIDRFEAGYLYDSSPVYHNVPLILNIEGPLNPEILEQSIRDVINRHEVLRTRIITEEDRPFQQVNQKENFSLSILDLSRDGNTCSYDGAIARALEEINRPFLLHEGPLIRAKLIRFENQAFILVITIHHIISDRYSIGILLEEFLSYYKGYLTKQILELPVLSIHYADFSQWQRELPVKLMESLLGYWKQQLSGKLQALELPTDRPRAQIHTYQSKSQSIAFSKELGDLLNSYGKQRGISHFVTLLAAFNVLLSRYSGHDEIVVGTSADNRNQRGLEKVIGPIANLMVIREYLSGTLSFAQLSSNLAKTVNDAFAHQQMPFDKLVLEVNPDIDMSRTALFDVLFQYENNPFQIPPVDNLELTYVETHLGWGKYDLNMLIQAEGDGFSGILVYNSDMFEDSTVSRMINHYLALLERVLKNPALALAAFSLLTDQEKEQLLTGWNQSQANYPGEKTIHELFEEQVEHWPDNVAVIAPLNRNNHQELREQQMSYRELNVKANQLAGGLREKGVKPDSIVGLLIDRSIEMIIGIIGVLKAGGAYLPIDPHYPVERVKFMLEDSDSKVILTTMALADGIGPEKEKMAVENSEIYKGDGSNPGNVTVSTDLAYVIYTSGTTGKPKGSLIEHRNVVQLMFSSNDFFDFNSDDVWTMFHSYCFDFSVWEMYGALLYGGKLIVIPKEISKDPGNYLKVLKTRGVSILNQTPTSFYHLADIEVPLPGKELKIKVIIFGGEALKPVKLKGWKQKYPGTRLVNMYGITETTVHVTYKEITPHEIESNISNIGKSLSFLSTYIMDDHLNLLPIGIPGELCVGGEGVGRGYLNRQQLTLEKFVENSFKPGKFLYRSGDLAKRTNRGEMEYLGRIDHQVKIRGFRIELREIESQLLKHERIREAVVVANDDEQRDKYLTAYIVPDMESEFNGAELREFLSEKLPDYMIPADFVILEKVPLTPNGKIDRNALDSLGTKMSTGVEYTAPRSEMEKTIAKIWKEVLNIDKVSIYDNFFDIGGHSLDIVKVNTKLRKAFEKDISVAEMFRFPTISSLAAYFHQEETGEFLPDDKLDEEVSMMEEATDVLFKDEIE